MTAPTPTDGPATASALDPLRTLFTAPRAAFQPCLRAGAVEIHTLVAHSHVPLYLFAVKSLARHWPNVTPVVHDDGTLTAADVRRLHRHAGGLRIISRAEADERVERMLADHRLLARIRRGNVRILQLLDYFLVADAEQVVGMDSDVVFLRQPSELIAWAETGTETYRYSPETDPSGISWIRQYLPDLPYIAGMCCGFTAVRPREFLDLDYLEHAMSRLPDEVRYAPKFVTQMSYSLLGGRLAGDKIGSLGPHYRSGPPSWISFTDDQAICHYFAGREVGITPGLLAEANELFLR